MAVPLLSRQLRKEISVTVLYSELNKIFRADDGNINHDKQQSYSHILTLPRDTLHSHETTPPTVIALRSSVAFVVYIGMEGTV